MTRPATLLDVQHILRLGAKNHERAGRRGDYDAKAAQQLVEVIVAGGGCFVTEGGMIGGLIAPFWASPEDVEAWEMFWFAEDGRGLELLDAFTAWAKAQGAQQVVLTTFKRDAKALIRRGFEPSETIYRKAV